MANGHAGPVCGVVRGHVVTAVGTLRSRLDEPWTLDGLANEVHQSRSQLVRAFDTTVGTSPMAYLRQMRVERMARLLISTDLSVAEAARSVGWKNAFYASRCFRGSSGWRSSGRSSRPRVRPRQSTGPCRARAQPSARPASGASMPSGSCPSQRRESEQAASAKDALPRPAIRASTVRPSGRAGYSWR